MAKKSLDLNEFLLDELRDLYDAEKQLVKTLPKMARAATSTDLKDAIMEHLEETKGHVQRIEECFEHLGQRPRSKPCKGLKGILDEGKEMLEEDLEPAVRDTAIAAGCRKVEHYEMAAYEGLKEIASQLEMGEITNLLGDTLGEEQHADQILAELSGELAGEAVSSVGESEQMVMTAGSSRSRTRTNNRR